MPRFNAGQASIRSTAACRHADKSGQAIAYATCLSVYYVKNPGDAPELLQEFAREAVRAIEERTGLDIVFEGVDADATFEGFRRYMPENYGERWSPVLVELSNPERFPLLKGRDLGGAPSLKGAQGPYYVTGIATFDTPSHLATHSSRKTDR